VKERIYLGAFFSQAAIAITDIYYFISKKHDHEGRLKAINALLSLMEVVSITKSDITKAMAFIEFTDLEDALQFQCLKKTKADYIITRDIGFQKISSKAISPNAFIKLISTNKN
jgi:predicted nucleic acid-binding protein